MVMHIRDLLSNVTVTDPAAKATNQVTNPTVRPPIDARAIAEKVYQLMLNDARTGRERE
jgi:hypothetical protein